MLALILDCFDIHGLLFGAVVFILALFRFSVPPPCVRAKASAGGVKRRDLITLCFHLEQTSKAGVPILESLQDLRDSTENPRLREVLLPRTREAAPNAEATGVAARILAPLVRAERVRNVPAPVGSIREGADRSRA